jgi:AraC-like DNA-binding protein
MSGRGRQFDHEDIRCRRDEGTLSLRNIAAEVGCSKSLVELVTKDMLLKCLLCQAPIPAYRSKCDACKNKNVEHHRRKLVERSRQMYKPHPRKASELRQRIKTILLERLDLTMPEIAENLGCSRIYVAKVAKREGIRRRRPEGK